MITNKFIKKQNKIQKTKNQPKLLISQVALTSIQDSISITESKQGLIEESEEVAKTVVPLFLK